LPEKVLLGAYVAEDPKGEVEVVLIATGSEVSLALESAKLIPQNVRVVSAPCLELFNEQSSEYKKSILPIGVPVISIEAACTFGWQKYAHFSLGLESWGASAPAELLFDKFGLVPEKVAASVADIFIKTKKLPIGPLGLHFE